MLSAERTESQRQMPIYVQLYMFQSTTKVWNCIIASRHRLYLTLTFACIRLLFAQVNVIRIGKVLICFQKYCHICKQSIEKWAEILRMRMMTAWISNTLLTMLVKCFDLKKCSSDFANVISAVRCPIYEFKSIYTDTVTLCQTH